jgi:hypothetical protein
LLLTRTDRMKKLSRCDVPKQPGRRGKVRKTFTTIRRVRQNGPTTNRYPMLYAFLPYNFRIGETVRVTVERLIERLPRAKKERK